MGVALVRAERQRQLRVRLVGERDELGKRLLLLAGLGLLLLLRRERRQLLLLLGERGLLLLRCWSEWRHELLLLAERRLLLAERRLLLLDERRLLR